VTVRHFRSILDLSPEQLSNLLETSLAIKRDGCGPILSGQSVALVFEKPSLRTRLSFEVAMERLGGRAIYLGQQEIGVGEREPVRDVARVLSRMVQGIAARTYAHETVLEFAQWSEVPVMNALSDHEHPCQALADLLTLRERFSAVRGLKLAYIGEGNNVARSLAYACVLAGMEFRCASPRGYGLKDADLERANTLEGGGNVVQLEDPFEAVNDVAAVYTDVWASMGEEHKLADRNEAFQKFRLNDELLAAAPPDAFVMHDLPAHRGEEITDEAMESMRSVVFDQAENRMHTQQAILAELLGGVVS
jgi:ornithine carbamoyltransferase